MIAINIERNLAGPDGPLQLQFSTTISTGELVTLYGPSGAGKSSILKILAGLLKPTHGVIKVEDHVWHDSQRNIFVKPQFRSVGMMFQEYALFPNMSVRKNLEYALEKDQDPQIVEELLHITELKNLSHHKPSLLSGGQKQRVALARALVRKPALLLLDEPLSALNTDMRNKLQDYILQVHQQFNLTTILVSHDLPEIMKMSKRMLVLENGLIKRDCSPQEMLLS